MELEEIEKYTGKISHVTMQRENIIITSKRGRFFMSKRSEELSEPSAIIRVSDYGIAKVIWVGKSEILQPFVELDKNQPDLKELTELMRRIHSNRQNELTLVHGDFSIYNTTVHEGKAKCFDYEHSHWGDPYIDIGRVVLRECDSERDLCVLFDNYSGKMPSLEKMRLGFATFCQRQYEMRYEKGLAFQEVPKLRAERLMKCSLTIDNILHALRDPVRL